MKYVRLLLISAGLSVVGILAFRFLLQLRVIDPCKILDQPAFVLCGRSSDGILTISLVRDGIEAWRYPLLDIPSMNADKIVCAFLLDDGNILFSCTSFVAKVSPDKAILWRYECPEATKCLAAQPLSLEKVFLCETGLSQRAIIVSTISGQIETECDIPEAVLAGCDPSTTRVQLLSDGAYLVSDRNAARIARYDHQWHEVWRTESHDCGDAIQLGGGNVMVCDGGGGYVREIGARGENVWKGALTGVPDLQSSVDMQECEGGKIRVCCLTNEVQKPESEIGYRLIEITPERELHFKNKGRIRSSLRSVSCAYLLPSNVYKSIATVP